MLMCKAKRLFTGSWENKEGFRRGRENATWKREIIGTHSCVPYEMDNKSKDKRVCKIAHFKVNYILNA